MSDLKSPFQNVALKFPDTAKERKEIPVMTGVLDYFPLAIMEVAKVAKQGNDQHNPGEPLTWARHKSNDHADCLVRHLMQRGVLDDDGFSHTAKVAWRALAMLQEELEAALGFTPFGDEQEGGQDDGAPYEDQGEKHPAHRVVCCPNCKRPPSHMEWGGARGMFYTNDIAFFHCANCGQSWIHQYSH